MPLTERVTKCTDELPLHMAISAKRFYSSRCEGASTSPHFHQHLGAFPSSGVEDDRALRSGGSHSQATTMRIPLKTEPAPTEHSSRQPRGSHRNVHQRNKLLPSHA